MRRCAPRWRPAAIGSGCSTRAARAEPAGWATDSSNAAVGGTSPSTRTGSGERPWCTPHRPAVNGRPIWGGLVPYDQVWRAGANENTTFETSSPITVEGRALPAGRYGLHVIPTTGRWTVVFSTMADAWGSFSYDEAEDALRVQVNPRPASHEERLSYRFDDPDGTSTTLVLRWEEVELPVRIAVDTPEVVLANMLLELRGLPRFFWDGWNDIAVYALQNDVHLDDALGWVDQSIALGRNGTNLGTKISLLHALGRTAEADALEAEFLSTASEADVNTYGYLLLGQGRTDAAIAVFERNVADHPDSWNVHDSLGEALAAAGRTAEAIAHYEHARELAPPPQQPRIDGILAQLRGSN
jgi:tetratricopeptide (TPR) repeat protein